MADAKLRRIDIVLIGGKKIPGFKLDAQAITNLENKVGRMEGFRIVDIKGVGWIVNYAAVAAVKIYPIDKQGDGVPVGS